MEPRDFKLIELVLVFGGVLAFAIWQLVSVNRELRRDREKQAAKDAAPSSPGEQRPPQG